MKKTELSKKLIFDSALSLNDLPRLIVSPNEFSGELIDFMRTLKDGRIDEIKFHVRHLLDSGFVGEQLIKLISCSIYDKLCTISMLTNKIDIAKDCLKKSIYMTNGNSPADELIDINIRNKLETISALKEDYKKRKSEKNYLYWWSRNDFFKNVGDECSREIVTHLLKDRSLCLGLNQTKRLLAVGSILHFAHDGDCVWGSGVNGKVPNTESNYRFQNLDVRAVRGPLTARFLEGKGVAVPYIFGDPGLLISELYPESQFQICKEKLDFVIVPHFSDNLENYKKYGPNRIVNPLLNVKEFIAKFLTAETVLASSVHGLVLAESYNKRAIWIAGNTTETNFKFRDYYMGTDRPWIDAPSYSVEAALRYSENSHIDLPLVKQRLLNSFPYDLWMQN